MRVFQSVGLAERLLADMIEDVPEQIMLPGGRCLATMINTDRPQGLFERVRAWIRKCSCNGNCAKNAAPMESSVTIIPQ